MLTPDGAALEMSSEKSGITNIKTNTKCKKNMRMTRLIYAAMLARTKSIDAGFFPGKGGVARVLL